MEYGLWTILFFFIPTPQRMEIPYKQLLLITAVQTFYISEIKIVITEISQ